MPLHDHHHRPLNGVLQWNSFHHAWLTTLAFDVNQYLPPDYYAEPGARFGIEVDVAALERMHDPYSDRAAAKEWQPMWSPPTATATVPFAVATDELEVLVYEDYSGGMRLVGAVEFLSPANKDRPENRAAFVSKCHGYLQRGVGLVLVDTMTSHHFNLHNDLMERIGSPGGRLPGHLYATGYHPTGKNGSGELTLWLHALAVGEPLPTVPLWLFGGISVPARLEETYERTWTALRVDQRLADLAAAEARRRGAAG